MARLNHPTPYLILVLANLAVDLVVFFALGGSIPEGNAISLLNDVTLVDGVLIGFVGVLTAENMSEIQHLKRDLQLNQKIRALYKQRDIRPLWVRGLLDVAVFLALTAGILSSLIEVAHVQGTAQTTSISVPIFVTIAAVTLFIYRLVGELFA